MEVAKKKYVIEGAPYASKVFRNKQAESLNLKIFIAPNQLQLLIADDRQTVHWIQPFECNDSIHSFFNSELLDELTLANELTERKFSSASVGIFTPEFMISPQSHSEENIKSFFANDQVTSSEHAEILNDQLQEVNARLTYSFPDSAMQTLQKRFETYSYQHATSAQIRFLSRKNLGWNVYIVIQNGWIQVLVLSGNQLKFANAFSFKTAEDFIYYIMSVFHSLELNPENVPVTLYGEILRDSVLFEAANKYIRPVKLGKPRESWKFEDDYPFPLHFYSSLLTL